MAELFNITIFVHVGGEALVKTASSALIPVCFIYRTAILELSLGLAGIDAIAVNTALEKSGTSFAGTWTDKFSKSLFTSLE